MEIYSLEINNNYMTFDKYVTLITEMTTRDTTNIVNLITDFQKKITNLYKKINYGGYNDASEQEINKLREILHNTNVEYKEFVNTNMDHILKNSVANIMYREFAIAAKEALRV